MKSYLTKDELPFYTESPITMLDAENATLAIDAYKGMSFFENKHIEKVKLSKKYSDYGYIYKGRLKHAPRIDIISVTAMTALPFGMQKVDCGADSVFFDDDDSPYFTFVQPRNLVFQVPTPNAVTVTYRSGYAQIPEQLKLVTAQLAANLKAVGGALKWQSREDFDLKLTLTKDGVFTSEIKQAINLIRLS